MIAIGIAVIIFAKYCEAALKQIKKRKKENYFRLCHWKFSPCHKKATYQLRCNVSWAVE